MRLSSSVTRRVDESAKFGPHCRIQVAQTDFPGATPLISLVSLSPFGNDSAATVGVFVITYTSGGGGVTVDNLRNALNKRQFLRVLTIIG